MSKKQVNPKTQRTNVATRPPVVVVLGHIDHGKTSLLDAIRKTSVAAKEAGGITQRMGAYQVETAGKKITFIDTPGHEAFSKMRERGAAVADLAVLVVAADDGVKPQTVEAIAHAKAAEVPLVVAINKVDLASPQNVTKVKGQLAKEGVVVEDQGGKIPAVAVSAKTGRGVTELLEMISLVADLLELKSDPEAPLSAIVIESLLSVQQGPLATLVLKKGTLRVGDPIFAGTVSGKVRALISDLGQRLTEAGPGMPVQILGFESVPAVGSIVKSQQSVAGSVEGNVVQSANQPISQSTQTEGLNVILRADTQGTLEAVAGALGNLRSEEKRINILLKGVGSISDSDIRLAATARGVVLGFNAPISPSTQKLADDLGVGVRTFKIIYELLEVAEKLLAGARALEEEEKIPEAEVLKTFTLHSGDVVAGVRSLHGKIKYRDRVKVWRAAKGEPRPGRGEEIVHQGKVRGLRIGTENVAEIKVGQEAGLLVKPNFEFKKGDRIVVS